ncbi:MAG: carbon monoxide dehydrogenase subunit G [Verrucomicrobiales bacterium]|jgi:carbon monoxide dehydrogenase subunit G
MKIENTFTVDAPIQDAWELLTNIPEITPCLPGAKLTDESDGVYTGGVKIKVGPVTSEYKGSAEFVEKDDTNYKAVINGKGRDTRGAGNAQALITAQMTAVGDKTKVDIETDLKVSGKVAQFGRGVMQDVSTKLLGQFAECLEAKIGEPAAIDGIAEASAEAAQEDAATDAEADESIVDKATDAAADVVVADDDDDDDEVLDLLGVAGGAVFKRFLPVLAVGIVVLIIIIWLIAK